MRILIVDTSIAIIQRLRDLVSDSFSIGSIYLSVSYPDASAKIKSYLPDLVLLDLSLPENKSVLLLQEIKGGYPGISVIALSNCPDKQEEDQFRKAGAEYFFDKFNEFEKIPSAIERLQNVKNKYPL